MSLFVRGFRCSGVTCGLKASGNPDLALISSAFPCSAAGLFTKNQFKAAPVLLSQQALGRTQSNVYGIVINSGQANACTGAAGFAAGETMRDEALSALNVPAHGEVLLMSTGVIGQVPNMDKLTSGIRDAADKLQPTSWLETATSIMTTDTAPKLTARTIKLSSGESGSLIGIAKGSGMIHPNMATMLCAFVTDISITPESLDSILRLSAEKSFHCIDVDGDMSTNDSVIALANHSLRNSEIDSEDHQDFESVADAFTSASIDLATAIVHDGEGATKTMSIHVEGLASSADARDVAHGVAQSSLVKCAAFGEDPNWGRILAAAGSVPHVTFDPDKVCLSIGSLRLIENGQPVPLDSGKAAETMKQRILDMRLKFAEGDGSATVWASDLSYDYVRINSEYTT